jgi:hypothetical protein
MGRRRSDAWRIASEVFISNYFGRSGLKLILGGGHAFLAFVVAPTKAEKMDL